MNNFASNNRCSSFVNSWLKRFQVNFLSLTLCLIVLPHAAYAQIEISEFMASNDDTLFDQDGDASDWIELHNTSNEPVSLDGWYLTDDEDELTQWQFPAVTITPNSFIIVFASDKERDNAGSELHTNFKLGRGGEYLALVAADGFSIVDDYAPEYPQQFEDISYGGESYFLQATPGTANSTGVTGFADPIDFDLEHGFYSSPQALNLSSGLPAGEIRYTLDGSEPSIEFGCEPPADGKEWSYNYFEGTWQTLPDFNTLSPVTSGTADTISVEPRLRDNNFGLRFKGCLEALTDGYYTLSTVSNSGSRLYLGDEVVIDNDGQNTDQTVSNRIFLNKGLHPVTVEYFESNGDPVLAVNSIAPLRGQTYLTTANDGMVFTDPSSSNDYVSFEFEVPGDGEFNFTVSALGVDSDSDSFWVQLNDQDFWPFEIGEDSTFQDIPLNIDGASITATLSAGQHTLTFFPREDGAQISSLTINSVTCEGPCGTQTLEAEIQDISGSFVMGGIDQESLRGESWHTYSSALTIDKTSVVRAVAVQSNFIASEITTNSYLFLDDIIDQSPNEESPAGWPEVDLAQQDMDYGMDPDIVGPDRDAIIESLTSLPSISIVTDIDNLLHADFGIYANAQSKGRYWERPAHVELIDNTGTEPGFSIDAGIRIRGGFSRRRINPKHPFRLYFRNSYDGDLDYPLFGDEGVDSFKRVGLRSPNNYSWASRGDARNTMLREVWSRDTQKALGHPYTRSRYYHMYINGQYWGVTMTQERLSEEYAESYFGGDEDDYDVVKHDRDNNKHFIASEGDNKAWNQIWDTVADQTISAEEYSFLKDNVDFENLIDYILSNGYEGDLDGATSWFSDWIRANNWYAMRDRTGEGLKWTFFQHDSEHSLGVTREPDREENVLGPYAPFDGNDNEFFTNEYMNPYWLHEALVSHPDYRQQVIDRVAELFSAGGVLSNEQGLIRWNERKAQVSSAILAHSARWGDSKRSTQPRTIADWQAEVDFVESTFFADRNEVVFSQLLALGLATEIPTPEVSIASGTTVDQGTEIDITNTSSGNIYYTTDGTDPRAEGGGISASAILLLPGESIVINQSTQLTIRVFEDGNWGAATEASYSVDNIVTNDDFLVIPLKNGKSVVIVL